MIIPVGFAQATHIFSSGFLPYGAVCTYGVDMQGYAGDALAAAEDLYTNWQAFISGFQSNTINHVSCRLKLGPNATGAQVNFVGEGVGGDGGTQASPSLAYLVEKNTALGGRQGRGRMFVPGVNEARIDSAGALDGAFRTSVAGNLGDWFASLIADNLPPVLLHADSLPPTDILSFSIDPVAATQRQRMRR